MSATDRTIDLTPRAGMSLRTLDKTGGAAFVQNIIPQNGEFRTRPGFGLVREFGTSLNGGRIDDDAVYGLGKCIGADKVRTPWGSWQILTVHPVYAFTGSADLEGPNATYLHGAVLVVHDVTTGRSAEFACYDQDATSTDLSAAFPHYATHYGENHTRWVRPQREPQWALFSPVASSGPIRAASVAIAIDGMGQWTYWPVDIAGRPDRKVDSLDCASLACGAGEQAAFAPLNLCDGALNDPVTEFVWLTASQLGRVQALGRWQDRTLYGVGNTLWFSDQLRPDNILALNRFILPTSDPITLIAEVQGMVCIATRTSFGVYRPADNGTGYITGGQWLQISTTVGCVSPQSYVVGDGVVFFMSLDSVQMYNGGLTLTTISSEIDRLWTDPQSLQMPLTDYYVQDGHTQLADPQLPARIDVPEQMATCRFAWDQNYRVLYCVGDDVTLVWTAGFGWHVWSFQTHAGTWIPQHTGGNAPGVRGLANIAAPTLVPILSDLYLVGGPDTEAYVGGIRVAHDSSCYLLKMGRGGALDRSTCADPATLDVWVAALAGVVLPGNIVRLTIEAVNYNYTVVVGDTLASAMIGSVAAASAGPAADVAMVDGRVAIAAKVAGATALAVSATVLIGTAAELTATYTATHLQTGVDRDLTDADLEDQRQPIGGWVKYTPDPQNTDATVYLGQPIDVPAGYVTPGGQTIAERSMWFPVMLGNCAVPPSIYTLSFVKATGWDPITLPASDTFDFVLPCERTASAGGYAQASIPQITRVTVNSIAPAFAEILWFEGPFVYSLPTAALPDVVAVAAGLAALMNVAPFSVAYVGGDDFFDVTGPAGTLFTLIDVSAPFPGTTIAEIQAAAPAAPGLANHVSVTNVGPGIDIVSVAFDGTTAAAPAWTMSPYLNVGSIGPDMMILLGFKHTGTVTSFGPLNPSTPPSATANIDNTGALVANGQSAAVYVWQQGRYPTEQEALANLQQPVDWAVKTRELTSEHLTRGRPNGDQIRIRGVFLTAMHFGKGANSVAPLWRYGPMNTATSTDTRDYCGQALDFTTTPPGNTEQNGIDPVARLMPVGGSTPALKTAGNVAKWGSTADATKGNLLVDDAAVDSLATTDGSQGEKASIMVHGTLSAPGESVRLGKVEAAVRVITNTRRRWH